MTHLVVAKAIAAFSCAAIAFGGGLLHRKLEARAQAEEAEALLAAEFARLEEAAPESNDADRARTRRRIPSSNA